MVTAGHAQKARAIDDDSVGFTCCGCAASELLAATSKGDSDMAKARFTTTRSISYDDDFDLEPCLALLRGDAIEEEEELEANPRLATASVIDDDDYDDEEEYDEGPYDSDAEYEDDE